MALCSLGPFVSLLNEVEPASHWKPKDHKDKLEDDTLTDQLKQLMSLLKHSHRKYISPAEFGNRLVSLTLCSYPKDVPETLNLIKNTLIQESSVDKGAKIRKMLSVPALRESISGTTEFLPSINLSVFYHDEDLREWLSRSLSTPLTYLFPIDSSSKLLILSFTQPSTIRVLQELYVDRHLKKNAFILGAKERERKQREEELVQIYSKKELLPKKKLDMIKGTTEFLKDRPDLGPPSLSEKLESYYQKQMAKLQELDSLIIQTRRKMSDIFEVAALLKERLRLYAVFKRLPDRHVVYLYLQEHWYECSNGHVERVSDDIWDTDMDDIACLWYQSGLESDLIELQEDVPEWIVQDNDALQKETRMDLI